MTCPTCNNPWDLHQLIYGETFTIGGQQVCGLMMFEAETSAGSFVGNVAGLVDVFLRDGTPT